MSKLQQWLETVLNLAKSIFDVRVLLLLLPTMLYIGYSDAAVAQTLVFSMAIMVAIAAISHWVLKIYFPYIDRMQYAQRAMETPLGASIVFLALALVLCMLLYTTMVWIRS